MSDPRPQTLSFLIQILRERDALIQDGNERDFIHEGCDMLAQIIKDIDAGRYPEVGVDAPREP
jgi:hypothetical protein